MNVRRGGGSRRSVDGADEDRDDRVPGQAPGTATGAALVVQKPKRAVRGPDLPALPDTAEGEIASAAQLDAFRELRTRLLSMASGLGLTHFTTLVVALSARSGASFVARNLAAAFTLQERRVAILVDCNLRHPTQHLALGSGPGEVGLFDYLERPNDAVDQLVRPTGIPGLHLIPAGHVPSAPREYFSSHHMRAVMAALRQAPCYVFLDGPPVKGSPDARILAEHVDFVVLVVGYGMDSADAIAQAAALFAPTKFAGVVFNECPGGRRAT